MIKVIIKKILNAFSVVIGKKRICYFYCKFMETFSFCNTEHVACLSTQYGTKEIVERKTLFKSPKFQFEGKQFNGPANWDDYLRRIYGDYMILPHESKRKGHNIIAYCTAE